METVTVYVSIGNSDDRLTQAEWSQFYDEVDAAVRYAQQDLRPIIYGAWKSDSTSAYQNACWCAELAIGLALRLRRVLSIAARTWRQDSIAWAEVRDVEFIKPFGSEEELGTR